jgi:hypothetical protein
MTAKRGFPSHGAKRVNPSKTGGRNNEGKSGSVGNEGYTTGSGPASDGLELDAMEGIKQVQRHHDKQSGQGHTAHGKDKGGLARILEPSNNADEFGKGTVGKPEELDAIRQDGNQDNLGDTTLIYGGGYFEREKAGLEDGVSLRETMDPNSAEPNYNYDIDPLSGNAPERKVGRSNNYDVKGKRGNVFEIGEM